MKNCCGECPYKVSNNHNDKIVNFAKRTGKKHKCHMIKDGNFWEPTEKNQCHGNKITSK